MRADGMVQVFGTRRVGDLVALKRVEPIYGVGTPARRLVNADGTPRRGLVLVEVVRVVRAEEWELDEDAIADGARASDYSLCRVVGSLVERDEADVTQGTKMQGTNRRVGRWQRSK